MELYVNKRHTKNKMGLFSKKKRCQKGFHRKGSKCVETEMKRERVTNREKQKPLRPIIPYFGGKTKVANEIISQFPEHDTLVEPFAGGASVYWKDTESKKFIINDKNKEVYNLYKTAKNFPKTVKSCKLNPSKSKFNKIKNKSKHSSCDTMVLHKHSFGADGKYYANHHGLRNNTFTDLHAEKLKKTTVLNQDFRAVMRKYDTNNKTVIYLDPPYVKGGDNYKIHGVTPKEVCDAVKKLKKAKAIISYDNNPEVKRSCKGLKISTISFKYSDPKNGGISNKKKTELLIKNY